MVKKPFTSKPLIKLATKAKGVIENNRGKLMRWRGGKFGPRIRVNPTGSIAAITKIAASVKISWLERLSVNSAIPPVNAT